MFTREHELTRGLFGYNGVNIPRLLEQKCNLEEEKGGEGWVREREGEGGKVEREAEEEEEEEEERRKGAEEEEDKEKEEEKGNDDKLSPSLVLRDKALES